MKQSKRKRRCNTRQLFLIFSTPLLLIVIFSSYSIYKRSPPSLTQIHESTINNNLENNINNQQAQQKSSPLLSKQKYKIDRDDECALLFFGLPKQFKSIVLPSIQSNILRYNPTCDVYLHTYNLSYIPKNARNREKATPFPLNEVYLLTNNVILDTLDTFLQKRNVTYYRQFFPPPNRNWLYPTSMDNMIKQWHSLESVWNYMESTQKLQHKHYKRIGLFRSDQVYLTPINITQGNAIIPEYGWNIPDREMNDRLFYGLFEYARIWAKQRFRSVQEFMKTSIGNSTGLHSETILYYIMMQYVPFFEQKKICAKRVRANGRLENDCWCKDFGKVCDWAKDL